MCYSSIRKLALYSSSGRTFIRLRACLHDPALPGYPGCHAGKHIQFSLYVYTGISSRPVLPGCFHPVSARRDIPSSRDDFLHINRNKRDSPPCRDEISVNAHALNMRIMIIKCFADRKMADIECVSSPSPPSSYGYTNFRWTPDQRW